MTTEMVDANNTMIAENRALYGNTLVNAAPILHHLAFSPTASGNKTHSAADSPGLKFDAPPPSFPGEVHDPSAAGSSEGASALSNKLLHEAFASLSLTDKCALSLSMSQLNRYNTHLLLFLWLVEMGWRALRLALIRPLDGL
jgi:hypothetical protein